MDFKGFVSICREKIENKKTRWKLIENLKYRTEREIQISFEYFDSEFFFFNQL